MELFLTFICYALGAVVGYEVVKFLRVAWFVHRLGKAKKTLDEANATLANQDDELIEGPLEKAFDDVEKSIHGLGESMDDLGKLMHDLGTFGAPIQKTSKDKEED